MSELDHAWATIPAECRGTTPHRGPASTAPGVRPRRPLHVGRHIVTVAVTAASLAFGIMVLAAWFADLKY